MTINLKNIFIWGFAVFTLSGCALYGKYERPDEVITKGIVRDATSDKDTLAVSDTASFGNLPWRSVFTDPQLQVLIEQGLENNTDLRNAALNVEMAKAQMISARLAFLPTLALTPSGTLSSWDHATPSKIYSLPVSASWDIDLFGGVLALKRGAKMTIAASKDYQLAVQVNVIGAIANMYYTLMMLDRQLEIVEEMSKLTKDTWDMMEALKGARAGYRSTGVLSAEANYYVVLSQGADLRRQIRETENALSVLLGQPAQYVARGRLENQSLPEQFSTGIAINMLSNRPDVHAAEMALAQCYHNTQFARSRFYPSINISGQGGYTNSGGGAIVNPGKMLLSAVGSLTQPILARGQIIVGLKVAKAQQEQAYNTWQNAIFKAGGEVSNALVQYNTYAERCRYGAKRRQALRKNVEDTMMLFTTNGASYLEVISAQANLLNAELDKVAGEFSMMQAVVSLYSALGGGVK